MITNSNQLEKVKHYIFVGLLSLVILALLCFLGYSNWQMFQRRREIKTELEQLNRKMGALEQEKKSLQASVDQENDDIIEEVAREQMNLRKPGEKVISIKRPEQEQREKAERKWWWRVLDKIKFWR